MRRPKCFGNFASKEGIHQAYDVDLTKHGDYCDCDWYCMTLCKHALACMDKQEQTNGE